MELIANIHLVIFIIVLLIARYYLIKARSHLTVEQKAKILDLYSSHSYYLYTAILLLLLIIVLPGNINPYLVIFGIALLFVVSIVMTVMKYRELKAAGLPKAYTDQVLLWNLVIYVMLIGFLYYSFMIH